MERMDMNVRSDYICMILQYALYFRRTTLITPKIVNTSYKHFRNCLGANEKQTNRKIKDLHIPLDQSF